MQLKSSKLKKLKGILTINKLAFGFKRLSIIIQAAQYSISLKHKLLMNKFCRILSWYDNEWGFSNRMIDMMLNCKKLLISENKEKLFIF